MNHELWNKITVFDLDGPPSEYGFSTRLANENFWTKAFTKEAILEYKKFMYLAATSEWMVSPSEIVDTVWHQHLIFTQSYQEFCAILGKQVQHVPSTHNREEASRFKQARERTTALYEAAFGQQPKNIWGYNNMFESLNLEKAKFKLRTFLVVGILAFIGLTVPAFFLLKPLYIHINNPGFVLGFIALSVSVLFLLEWYNRAKLRKIVSEFDPSSFVFHLQPYELVYLKTQQLAQVIHGEVSELVDRGIVKVNADNTLTLEKSNATTTNEQLQVTSVLHEMGTVYYPALLNQLLTKPIFWNYANAMDAFRKYFNKSKKFGRLYYTNFIVCAVLLLLSFTRIVTGVLREKPVPAITMVTFFLVAVIIVFLIRLTRQIATTTIPGLYKQKILPASQVQHNWQWTFFLLGSAVLATAFIPLVNYANRNDSSTGGCGTSCGSSCGSSCSSCGGCGGD